MYRIIKKEDGGTLGLCDKVRYTCHSGNGTLIECQEAEAECVSIGGTAYPLGDIVVQEVDGGELAYTQEAAARDASEQARADIAYIAMMADIEL